MPLPRTLDVSSASEPYEVRSKYQQAQIEQLSRQCEDLRKQRAADLERITVLEAEQRAQDERATTAMKAIQERWKSEKSKRKEDLEIWKSLNTIANLDTRVVQYNGMLEEMKWREASRQDGIAILAREFKLAEFQAKESEIYAITGELEEKLRQLTKQNDKMTAQWALSQTEVKEVQDDSAHLKEHVTSLETELQTAKKAANELRKELRLSQHAVQAAERLKLELEGIQDENANLHAQLAELQRGNSDLKRQTEKWKKLETKNDQELKARMDLEVAKGELEERVQDLASKDKESTRELKKLRTQIKTLERNLAESEKQLKKTQQEMEDSLVAPREAEVEMGKALPSRGGKENVAGPSKPRTRKVADQELEAAEEGDESEVQEEQLAEPVRFSRPKAPARQRQAARKAKDAPSEESHESDANREEQSLQKRKGAKRKRQKSPEGDSGKEEDEGSKQKAKSPPARSTEDSEAPRKKTKRKLNVFDNQTTFQWNSVQPGDGTLGIPLELSPIKEGAPKRSMSFLGRLTEHMW